MAIVRWNPLFSRSLSQWPDLWDDDLLPGLGSQMSNSLDVFETDNDVVVRANVAGVKENDIDLTFEKGVLFIKATRVEEEGQDESKHFSKSSWDYSYKVSVPGLLDHTAEPKVELEDGMLVVTFKKAEASKPRKLSISKKG